MLGGRGGRTGDDRDGATTDRRGWVDFRLGYQPAFDGLRGLGVMTFILYHGVVYYEAAVRSWFLPGAYLWLELFFVQSGFLITSLLLEERYRTGFVRLRNFYARRAIRLFPALFVLIVLSCIWLLTFSDRKGIDEAWTEVWASLFYYMNWIAALHINLFPHYLSHVWSLSIEEQFYVVMPIAMLLLLRRRPLARILPIMIGAALVSATWMAILATRISDDADLGRLYYGTDTRAQALFIGVAFAIAVHSGRWLNNERHAELARVWGWVGTVVLCILLFVADLKLRPMYYGFFLVCSTSVVGMLSEIIAHPKGLLARTLSWRPLQFLGEMTYGLYLWHWPVVLIAGQFLRWPAFPLIAFEVSMAVVVATVSYYGLERPLMRRFAPRFPRVTPEREAAQQRRLAELEPRPPQIVVVGATASSEMIA